MPDLLDDLIDGSDEQVRRVSGIFHGESVDFGTDHRERCWLIVGELHDLDEGVELNIAEAFAGAPTYLGPLFVEPGRTSHDPWNTG
jgi:hypothetical protein